jgi:hypothetical protein
MLLLNPHLILHACLKPHRQKKKERKRTVETNMIKIVLIFSSDLAILVAGAMLGR